jgi:4-hydroxy-tetrahydrodipicolinate synthase
MHGVPLPAMERQHVQSCRQEKGRRLPAAERGPVAHPSRQGGGRRGNGSPGATAEHRNPPRTIVRVVWSAKSAVETGMSTKMLTGSFVALITPFNRDGSVDFAAFRTLLKFQEDRGTSAVLIMGSTGETSMLSPEEKKQIIVETAKMKTGRMPIFFGCTGNNTEATIANVRFAKDNGADGAILAAPAYICAPESDIERFFLDVADATDLPLGIYNNPPRVKSDLHWDHLLRIFKHPNYVVHKESTARVGQVAQVLAGNPKVSVMCCDSPNLGLVVPTMSLGGHGTANMTGNIAPAELATISTPWTSYVEAENFRSTYLKLLPLLHFTYSAINPVAVKSLMKAIGLPAGNLRKPLTNLEGDALAKGVRIVSELGLDKRYGYKMKPISAVAA